MSTTCSASGVGAVVLNVTATNPTDATFVTVWPTGQTRPAASNLNVVAEDPVRGKPVVAGSGREPAGHVGQQIDAAGVVEQRDLSAGADGGHDQVRYGLADRGPIHVVPAHPPSPTEVADGGEGPTAVRNRDGYLTYAAGQLHWLP